MQPVNFNLTIGVIKISMVENASAVNIGKNLLVDWDSHSKSNQGFGNISGDSNALEQLANHVEDPDKIDLFSPAEPVSDTAQDLRQAIEAFFKEEL
jgi:hypothetical protein